jgi:hypothetical protein
VQVSEKPYDGMDSDKDPIAAHKFASPVSQGGMSLLQR